MIYLRENTHPCIAEENERKYYIINLTETFIFDIKHKKTFIYSII